MSMKSKVRASLKGFAAYRELYPFFGCLLILVGGGCAAVICATTQTGAAILGSTILVMCAGANSPKHIVTLRVLMCCLWCFAALLTAFELTKGQGTLLVATTFAFGLSWVLHDIYQSDDDPE